MWWRALRATSRNKYIVLVSCWWWLLLVKYFPTLFVSMFFGSSLSKLVFRSSHDHLQAAAYVILWVYIAVGKKHRVAQCNKYAASWLLPIISIYVPFTCVCLQWKHNDVSTDSVSDPGRLAARMVRSRVPRPNQTLLSFPEHTTIQTGWSAMLNDCHMMFRRVTFLQLFFSFEAGT